MATPVTTIEQKKLARDDREYREYLINEVVNNAELKHIERSPRLQDSQRFQDSPTFQDSPDVDVEGPYLSDDLSNTFLSSPEGSFIRTRQGIESKCGSEIYEENLPPNSPQKPALLAVFDPLDPFVYKILPLTPKTQSFFEAFDTSVDEVLLTQTQGTLEDLEHLNTLDPFFDFDEIL